MTEEEQEALSVKYWATYKIARLTSGRLALFDYDYKLVGTYDTFEQMGLVEGTIPPAPEYIQSSPAEPRKKKSSPSKPDTSDLLDLL